MTAGDVTLLLGCLALVTWSSWRWAAVSRLPGAVDVLVACGVLMFGTTVGTVLLVGGVLHALSTGPVVAAALGSAVLAGAATGTRAGRALVADARRAQRVALHRLGRALRSPLVLLLALAATAAVGYRLAIAVAFPVVDWDALAYHLPMADYWLQERRLLTNPFSYWAQIHPGAAESAVAWLGALTGTVRTAAGVQIGGALLGALAAVGLARGAGCSPRSSLVSGLLFLLAPIVLTQLSTAEVDIVAAATLLAAWHLVLVALRGRRPETPTGPAVVGAVADTAAAPPPLTAAPAVRSAGRLALAVREKSAGTSDITRPMPPSRTRKAVLPALAIAGTGAGVAVGVKSPNLVAVAVLGLVLLATTLGQGLREHERGRAVRRAVVRTACFGLPAVVLGGWWYVRNALLWGNPVYPLSVAGLPGNPDVVALLDIDVRQVGTTNPLWAVLVSWASDLEWRTYFYASPIGGLGAPWILALAPAVLVAFVLLSRSRHRLYAWCFLAPGIFLLVVYPGQHHPRYTIYLLGLGGLALAVVLDRLARWLRQALLTLVTAAALFSAAAASWQALDLSGSFDQGPTPPEVAGLMRGPASERGAVGLRGAFVDIDRAGPGTTFVVPPEFGDWGQPWVLSHSLWGDDLRRRVVKSSEPIADPDAALQALGRHHAEYVVVTKGSPLEADLFAQTGQLHAAFDVGWLARAWAPGPGPGPEG